MAPPVFSRRRALLLGPAAFLALHGCRRERGERPDVGIELKHATGTYAAALPARTPVDRVVFIIKENRTYDALFGGFPEGEPEKHRAARPCPGEDDSNDQGIEHGRLLSLDPSRHVECHDPDDLVATYHALARNYALCARYFSEVGGPSFPNHLMMLAGEYAEDDDPAGAAPADWKCPRFCYDFKTLPDQMADAGLSWKAYDRTDFVSSFSMIRHLAGSPNIVSWKQFELDARAGTLPNLSYLFSDYQDSEHPPTSLCQGQLWTLRQLRAIAVVERDKHGRPLRYGHRVPCIVVSPFARQGYISVQPHSHLSLLRFAEGVFGLPPLNRRVEESSAMADCFDFSQSAAAPRLPPDPDCSRTTKG